ncbi:NlpC/P60 family protein [Actinomyces gaoshouyii]|uniref:NlpC/P60 family protein n=1 Tax=Actinomyces gaoshouyii TaxID=1960083 RepID=UPI0009BE39C6|nr:NlpC/P60 family protein [Actinomyces gaoshouyii]ARD42515.1 hypothetical protein B6G06_09310 [Actinomyces gaoshouyii]
MRDDNENSRQEPGAAREIIKGGVTGGVKGAAVAGVKALVRNRRAVGVAGLAALIVALAVFGTIGGSTVTSGVSHVNNVALNGSATSGFEGAAQESGLGDDAVAIAEYAESVGVPAELVLALVDTTRGPWRAADGDVVGNARTVADALEAAKDATSADAGWDMLAGTMACSGDVLVIEGQACPDGFQTDEGDGARQARLVREAWVAALMAMGEGLGAPQAGAGSAGGNADALAAPDELGGEPSEMITTLATSTYGLDASAVSVDGDQVVVSTEQPLPLATTIVSRHKEIRVSYLEADGQSWDPVSGWQPIQPEAGPDVEDPTAASHVRVWTCSSSTGSDCSDEPTAEPVGLTREQADEVYSRALAWRLGSTTGTCTTRSTASASSSVSSVASSTTGETIEITPARAGYVSAVIDAGRRAGASDDGIVVALMVVLQESRLNMYANSANPESLALPHDAVGSDHDSVGLFQQRDSWGSTAERMDASTSADLFFARLVAWMDSHPGAGLGQMAQAVQASAFPDAYAQWEEAARQLAGGVVGGAATPGCTQAVTGAGWLYPIVSVGTITSDWDPARMHPVLGYTRPHWGTDIAGLPIGTDLVAVADGTVTHAGCDSSGLCQINYDTTNGWRIRYLHIVAGSWTANEGEGVTAGQVIAKLGNTGIGTGAHLHVETSPLNKIGENQWCAFDASWADRCTNPVETFAAHGVDLATGAVSSGASGGSSSGALDFARTKVGGPYVWGGNGPTGYDCSGLVQASFASVGVSLPRTAQEQCRAGTPVDASQAQAGDIVCWGSPAHHVAIYDGNGGIVGAQSYSDGIAAVPLYGDYYFRRLTN